MKKPIPIGISDFKLLIEGGYLYVDKSLFIEELLQKTTAVALIPRFRRFGKTLNLSMLHYFFEKSNADTSYLFKNLNIWKSEKYRALQGKFPVIFITLKDVKFTTWEATYSSIKEVIAKEFQRHRYLLDGDTLFEEEKVDFIKLLRKESDQALLCLSLLRLTEWMSRYYKKKTIVLIDEYDTPAHAAYVGGFYDRLISFLRNWLSGGLKDNPSLERGVLTGILRIAKESIFSGLNNISTFTVLNEDFGDKFGLMESEVQQLLHEYELTDHYNELKKWYNGYRIGSLNGIYNPWSVLNCIANKGKLFPYWVNTSDNALMKQLIAQGGDDFKTDVEDLLRGKAIEKRIEEGIIFSNLEKSPNSVWALLLFSGYLTLDAMPSYGAMCSLRIPNEEVLELYKVTVLNWFESTIHESKYRLMLNSLISGDIETFSQIFKEFMLASLSVFDVSPQDPEILYHAFVLGMLLGLRDKYEIKSNRESGYGRYDVMLIPKNQNDLGLVLEFKKIGRFEVIDLESAAEAALLQIQEKWYDQELFERGIKQILHIGLAFKGKHVLIRSNKVF